MEQQDKRDTGPTGARPRFNQLRELERATADLAQLSRMVEANDAGEPLPEAEAKQRALASEVEARLGALEANAALPATDMKPPPIPDAGRPQLTVASWLASGAPPPPSAATALERQLASCAAVVETMANYVLQEDTSISRCGEVMASISSLLVASAGVGKMVGRLRG